MDILGAWIAVFLTLAIFSFLYKDNAFYKIAAVSYTHLTLPTTRHV